MTQKHKIAFVIDSLNFGGAERSLVTLLRHLDYDRLDVDLYAWNFEGKFALYLPEQVRKLTFPTPAGYLARLWHHFCAIRYSLTFRALKLLGINRHLAETFWRSMHSALPEVRQTYDVVVAYQQGFATYYAVTKMKAAKKIAWVNCQLNGHNNHRERFNHKFYDKMDNVVVVSEALYNIMCKANYVDPKKLFTIYDIMDAATVRHMAFENLPLKIEVPADSVIITTVARMSAPKNYPLAVHTARILKDRDIKFRWIFVGDGVMRTEVERLIGELDLNRNIILTGFQINPYPLINMADVYVQTSLHEGFGLTIAEAKMLAKPIVSTDFSVVHDQLTDGVNGLIAAMTPESLADKIQTLISNPDLRKRLGQCAVSSQFTDALTEVNKFYSLCNLPPSPRPSFRRGE